MTDTTQRPSVLQPLFERLVADDTIPLLAKESGIPEGELKRIMSAQMLASYATVERLLRTLELQLEIAAFEPASAPTPINLLLITPEDYERAVLRFDKMAADDSHEGSPIGMELVALSVYIAKYQREHGLQPRVQYLH